MINLVDALGQILTVAHFSHLLMGVVIGLIVGIIPGLGGIAGMSLLLPFLYGMDPSVGLGMLMGLIAVIPTGDTFASVLMGIPGSSASQATVMDGFPLAKKGMAARALSAAFTSSLLGGLVGALILSIFIVVARPLVLAFSSAELFMLTLLGLSVVATLSGGNIFKGLAACGIGLLIGTIGSAPATGEFRMTMGIDYLYDGIPLVIIGLGIFALPEIIDLLIKNKSISSKSVSLGQGWVMGIKDVFSNLPLVGKCSVFGSLVGAIPGLAGSVVDWMTYGFAKQSSKDNSQFGHGDIRGVIAPESANNACASGSMIPTILFGVPGSGTAAVFLGGMLLLGIQPGISMVDANLSLTYTIVWSLALANILGALLCLTMASPVSMLTRIPFSNMAPILLSIILFAAYQATNNVADLVVLCVIGAIGILMKLSGWSRPAFLIGFVLAPGAENYFFQSIQFHGFNWIDRPGVIIIGSLILISFLLPVIKKIRSKKEETSTPTEKEKVEVLDIMIIMLTIAFCAFSFFSIYDSTKLTKAFPLVALSITVISIIGIFASCKLSFIGSESRTYFKKEIVYITAFLFVSLAYYYIGFIASSIIFIALFLHYLSKVKAKKIVLIVVGFVAFLTVMKIQMNVYYPEGIIDPYLYKILLIN